MDISKRLLSILEKKSNVNNQVCQALLELKQKRFKFINGLGYLDIALGDSKNISYITKEREKYFKRHNFEDGLGLLSIMFVKPGLSRFDTSNKGLTIVRMEGDPDGYGQHDFIYTAELSNGTFQTLRYSDFKNYYYYVSKIRRKYAYMIKAGKIVNKLFPKHNFDSKEIENFSKILYVGSDPLLSRNLEFILVDSEEIPKYYNENKYYSEQGSLGSSCMRDPRCGDRFGIYSDHGVKLLVLSYIPDGSIVGRALVWPDIQLSVSKKATCFLDRIYTNNYKDEYLFLDYAIKNKWITKNKQSYNCKEGFLYPETDYNENISEEVIIQITNEYHAYPYLDTFSYLSDNLKTISNYRSSQHFHTLDNYVTGSLEENEVYCELNDSYYQAEEVTYSDYHNCQIPSNEAVEIGNEIVWRHHENVVTDVNGRFQFIENCRHSIYLDAYVLQRDCVHVLLPDGKIDIIDRQSSDFSEYYDNLIDDKDPTCVKLPIVNIKVYMKDFDEAMKHYNIPFRKELSDEVIQFIDCETMSIVSSNTGSSYSSVSTESVTEYTNNAGLEAPGRLRDILFDELDDLTL